MDGSIEAEDLLWHVLGEERIRTTTSPSSSDGRSIGWSLVVPPVSPSPSSKAPPSSEVGFARASGVFVPRDASEFLAVQAMRLRGRARPVHVDLATGAGTTALAVANEVPGADVVGTDLSADAVKLARTNAKRLGVRARFFTGDLFGGLRGRSTAPLTSSRSTRRTCRCTSWWTCPRRSGDGSRSTR